MNGDHVDSMIQLARTHARIDASEATMTSIDRLGFYLRLKTADGMKGIRINFPGEVATSKETREMLVAMVRQARLG
jgi:heme iron utilization protein